MDNELRRDIGDAIEREWARRDQENGPIPWRARSMGIHLATHLPENLPPIGQPKPDVDAVLAAEFAAQEKRERTRRMIKATLISIAFVCVFFTCCYILVKVLR